MQNNLPSEIADFVVEHSDGLYSKYERVHIEKYVYLHMQFGTLMVVKDHATKQITGVARWNWKSPTEAKVLDCIIHKDYRRKDIMKNMLLQAKKAMPNLESISFNKKKEASVEHHRLLWLKGNFKWQKAEALK